MEAQFLIFSNASPPPPPPLPQFIKVVQQKPKIPCFGPFNHDEEIEVH